ncbi:MAG TPA: SLBB domain-containing protein [Planctomycetaceae bacterium]|nr:SLBB domain-containing protein [Planctomycetaceae bacterium]
MWSRRAIKLQTLLLSAALCSSQCALAQLPAVETTTVPAVRPDAMAFEHYAVVGAVAHPGAYRLPATGVQLVQLVEQAGGLSGRASGAIRLVRGDRAGTQWFYSPKLEFELLPGDVLIVDDQAGGDPNAPLQIALLHLLHRPVVVSVPPESASLTGLFRMLGQAQNGRLLVRLLVPGQGDQVYRADRVDQVPLSSCAVVMFAPETIDIQQVPLLPRALNEPLGIPAAVTTVADRAVPSLPRLTQVPPAEPSHMRVANVSDVVRDSVPIDVPDVLPLPESHIEAPAPPRVRHAESTNERRVAENSRRHSPRTSKATSRKASGSLAFLMLVAATIGGVLTAAGWLVWNAISSRKGKPKALTPEDRLESLVRNQLPIVTEKLVWPANVPLHGRSDSVRLRYDSAHQRADATPEIPSPHMPLEAARPREAAPAPVRRTPATAVASDAQPDTVQAAPRFEPQRRVDTPQKPTAEPTRTTQRAGVLERALMRMQESSR